MSTTAEVEGLIRNVTKQSLDHGHNGTSDVVNVTAGPGRMNATTSLEEVPEGTVFGFEQPSNSFGFVSYESVSEEASSTEAVPVPDRVTSSKRSYSPQPFDEPRVGGTGIESFSDGLIELGRFEGLPPFEMIEDL